MKLQELNEHPEDARRHIQAFLEKERGELVDDLKIYPDPENRDVYAVRATFVDSGGFF